MKPAAYAVLLSAVFPWLPAAVAADAPALLRYSIAIAMRGFEAPAAVLETVRSTRRPPPQAMDLWKDCPHPQALACARPPALEGDYTMVTVPSWKAFGPMLQSRLGPELQASTTARARRLQGLFTLVYAPRDTGHLHTGAVLGRRLLLAVASRPFKRPQHDFSASWSSTLDPGSLMLPAGYELVTETFATVELRRCAPRAPQCETETLYQHAYPGDGVGGFEIPMAMFEPAPDDELRSLTLYLEQRVSIGPAADLGR